MEKQRENKIRKSGEGGKEREMEKWARVKYQPMIPMGKEGKRITAGKEHILLSKEAAKEGMVLLKNEGNVLPLKAGSRVALFGKGTFDYVKGGGGSGDVTVSYIRNLYEGFKELPERAGVYEELADFYRENVRKQYEEGAVPGMTVEPEVPEKLLRKARAYTDTAIISICRFSGEGWDRKCGEAEARSTEDKRMAEASNGIFDKGDFYLTTKEEKLVRAVTEAFDRVVVVLNVGGMVDTDWFAHNPKIQSVLMAWQGGIEGGLAAAELLTGLGNPSGKLSDTFAKRLEDYPSTEGFHQSDDFCELYRGYLCGLPVF